MFGELIYEGKGKTIGVRMLNDKGTMEMTFQEEGTILGIPCSSMTTFVCTQRPDGMLVSEGPGIMYTKDGDTASFKVYTVIIPKGMTPASSVRGAKFFNTQSPKLARLNTIVCISEVEMKEDNTYTVKEWEWK